MDELARIIDHAVLKPDSTLRDVERGCRVALEYQVAAICVSPSWVSFCSRFLKDSAVKTGTVNGFPHGASKLEIKMAEAEAAIDDGADEIDTVVNIGRVLSDDWEFTGREVRALTGLVHSSGSAIKFIFETCYLQPPEIIRLCRLCSDEGADFVKTSTGFGSGGATEEDVRLMAESVSGETGIKAAGGIRDLKRFLLMKNCGATRIGTSSTVEILEAGRREGLEDRDRLIGR